MNDALTFNELKALLRTTDGNLSVHARKLEDAGYVACTKSFEGRLPRTEYRLTAVRPPGARPLSRSHGGAHPRDAGALGRLPVFGAPPSNARRFCRHEFSNAMMAGSNDRKITIATTM